ncbi:MAG: phosphatase PAP2 family protein [Demequinaceae bacterium]|nr:phosphatase PAP2 family protein [Demequinaceae bacterium]
MIRRWFSSLPSALQALVPGLLLTGAGLVGFAVVLDQFLERDDLYIVDQPVLEGLARARTPWLTTTLTWVTNAFGPGILPLVVGAACFVWWRSTHRWRDPAVLVGAMVTSTFVAVVVKAIVHRPRPSPSLQVVPGLETSFSFPSGHTTGAATLVLTLGYLLWRGRRGRSQFVAWALASVVIIALVGGSRLYLGYHFVTDVAAGACLGVVTLGLVVAASRMLDHREASHH